MKGQVFVGCRGDNKIIMFNEQSDGKLEMGSSFKVGDFPRHFSVIEREGFFIFVACQKGNIVERYHVSEKVVLLNQLTIKNPTCVIPVL